MKTIAKNILYAFGLIIVPLAISAAKEEQSTAGAYVLPHLQVEGIKTLSFRILKVCIVPLLAILCINPMFTQGSDKAPRSSSQNVSNEKHPARQASIRFEAILKPQPSFPRKLAKHGITEGYAIILVSVSEEGSLVDWLTIEASDRSIIKEVEKVIWDWWFSIPEIDGIPRQVCNKITITFNAKMIQSTATDTSGGLVNRHYDKLLQKQRYYHLGPIRSRPYRIVSVAELDQYPEATYVVPATISPELLRECMGAEAVFEFYIDEKGYVRIPSLKRVEGYADEVALNAAQQALLQWKFKPPTVNGKPVTVKVAQPFIFSSLYLEN